MRCFTLERFKEALEGFKSIIIEPRKCFYTDSITYGKILDGMIHEANYSIYIPLGTIDLIVDQDIGPGMIVYCEPGLYDIWKRLKYHQWIDQTDEAIDLWKVAAVLFSSENEIYSRPPSIDLLTTNYLRSEIWDFWRKK